VQRKLVLDAVRAGCHPSAREIFVSVSQSARVSFGTVYRNLQVLEEEGEIARVEIDPEVVRYDWKLTPHHHFRCVKCGRVLDFPVPCRVELDRDAEEESGFVVERRLVAFEGICPECRSSDA
jgi:Fe2+ or Zn2+ uptake regulation protein